ncbi:MAG: LysR family transcriptional regulator [Pyramidobacter sp.]|nr:LysR family transcriptional regulator [Pyramidobacter sp.]
MNFLWLEYFTTVADEGSMAKAAEKIRVSLPSVSQVVRKLESEVGVPLFERRKSRLYLTDAGARFLDFARETLLRKNDLLREFRTGGDVSGEIRLATTSTRAGYLLPLFLPAFKQRCPRVSVKLDDASMLYEERFERLKNGEFDFIVTEPRTGDTDLEEIYLCREYDYIVLRHDSDIFRRNFPDGRAPEHVSLERFAAEPFLQPSVGKNIRRRLDAMFREYGVQPNIAIECKTIAVRESLVASGFGYAIINYPETISGIDRQLHDGKLCCVRIDHPLACRRLALLYRKSFYLSRAHREFIKTAVECLSEWNDAACEKSST